MYFLTFIYHIVPLRRRECRRGKIFRILRINTFSNELNETFMINGVFVEYGETRIQYTYIY